MDGVAVDFSRTKWGSIEAPTTPMFNVTVITSADNKKLAKKKNDQIHIINLDHKGTDLVKAGGANFDGLKEMENNLINQLLRADDSDYKRRVRAVAADKYDGGFMLGAMPFEILFSKDMFDIPILKWFTYLPDPIFMSSNFNPFTDIGA